MKVKGDVAAERAILAGICQFGANGLVDVQDIIDIDSFTVEANQVMFKCLEKALEHSNNIDVPSIYSAANSLGLGHVVTNKSETEFIRALFQTPIKYENVRQFAVKIKKIAVAKRIQDKLEQAYKDIGQVTGNESIDKILSIAESPIFDLSNELNKNSDERPQKMFEDVEEYLKFLEENPVDQIGISTGFPLIDLAIGGGLRKGSVHLFAARPKTGKTSFAKQFSLNISKRGTPVLMLDTEMNKKDQVHRSVASETGTKIRDIETGRFGMLATKNEIYTKMISLQNIPYYYKNVAGKPFDEIISIIRRWISQEVGKDANGQTKDCVVLYDYFKLMDSSVLEDMQEYQAMGFQISKLTDFCNLNNITCGAFVQVNREGIVKETSDIISQSDRLLWLCGSVCLIRRKTQEEIAESIQDGNTIVRPLESRFGGLEDGDYINFAFDKEKSILRELNTHSQSALAKKDATGGMVASEGDDDEPIDDSDSEVPFNDDESEDDS